jgi:photosystem II stability/assembly factor-like uncharacterized protein
MAQLYITSMRRLTIIATLSLLFIPIATAFAQGWERLSADNKAVQMIDRSTIVVVGEMGKIVRSDDGGVHWRTQRSGSYDNLRDVHFTSRFSGVIVGDNGTILRTTDGGEHWSRAISSTDHRLYKVASSSATSLFVVGAEGTLLTSDNSGASWAAISSGVSVDIYGISFADENIGVAVGNNGTVIRTTDGGSSWSRVTIGTDKYLLAVDFADTRNGITVGDSEATFRTTDAGASWLAGSDTNEHTAFLCVDMIDSLHAAGVGADPHWNTACVTSDGGVTWEARGAGLPKFFAMAVSGVSFIDTLNGFVVGNLGLIARTTDGGQSWAFCSYSPLSLPVIGTTGLFDAAFAGMDTASIAAAAGTILRTTDGGATWVSMQTPATDNVFGIHYFDHQSGFAVSSTFSISMVTDDAGLTWNMFTPSVNANTNDLHDVRFLNHWIGHAVSDSFLFTITDRGRSWSGRRIGGDGGVPYHVQFVNPDVGFIIRGGGADSTTGEPIYFVQRTLNAGETWQTILRRSGNNEACQSLWFLDSLTGFVCAGWSFSTPNHAKLLRTTNGGRTWDSVLYGVPNLVDIRFFSPTIGFLVGAQSQIYMTTDGGSVWTRERPWPDSSVPDTTFDFSRIAIYPDGKTVLVYGWGVILRKEFPERVASVENTEAATNMGRNPYLYLDIRPNPIDAAGAHITVYGLYSVRGSEQTLGVFDILGRRIMDLTPNMRLNGSGSIAEVDLDATALPIGSYMLVFRAGSDVKAERIVISQ